jgi:hypothetical protein
MATSGAPVLLLGTPSGGGATANGTGTRAKCSVNFGFGEVPQGCTTFYVDISATGAPTGWSVQLMGGINEQGTAIAIGAAITQASTAGAQKITYSGSALAYWYAVLSGLTGGTAPSIRAVGISANP